LSSWVNKKTSPDTHIPPLVGFSLRVIRRNNVDLPEPFAPMTQTLAHGRMVQLALENKTTSSKALDRLVQLIIKKKK
jgi:hypothetical protein